MDLFLRQRCGSVSQKEVWVYFSDRGMSLFLRLNESISETK